MQLVLGTRTDSEESSLTDRGWGGPEQRARLLGTAALGCVHREAVAQAERPSGGLLQWSTVISPPNAGCWFDPWPGAKTPHASQHKTEAVMNSNKEFLNGPHFKK